MTVQIVDQTPDLIQEEIQEEETAEQIEEVEQEEDSPVEEEEEEVAEAAEPEEEGELTISLGDEPEEEAPEEKSPVIRDLRKSHKDMAKAIRQKERELAEKTAEIERLKGANAAPEPVGNEPSLDDPDIDYDTEKFKAKFTAWHSRKSAVEAEQQQRQREIDEQNKVFQARHDAVIAATKALRVPDLDDAAESFDATFTPLQRGIIIGGPDDPKISAQLRYVLGRNPTAAKKLADIKDPVKFAFAIADTMTKLKVSSKKTAPPPERVVRSSVAGAAAGNSDAILAKLREEANKTGNMDKVMAYKAELRAKAKK